MLARFNTLYHSQLALEEAILNKYKNFEDDFETFIPIYPYPDEEGSKRMAGTMEEIMKRVSKIIQERPKSKWVDDAFLIIAQTHFYSFEMFKATDAFQYIFNTYDDPDVKLKSEIWLMKSYMREEKFDDAEALLDMILEEQAGNTLSKQNNSLLYLSAADLMVVLENYDKALKYIKMGVKTEKVRYLRYRSHFLAGQVHLKLGNFDNAAKSFHQVNKLNAPYDYVFQANLGIINAARQEGSEKNIKLAKRELKQMLRDDKNIDYFDQIYFELAKIEFDADNSKDGLDYLMLSANYAGANQAQKTKTYLYIADYFFNSRNFTKAQAYYDSTIAVMPETYPNYEQISKKHIVLSGLIDGLKEIQRQDSLITLAELPREKLDARILKIHEAEKEAERVRKENEELQRQQDIMDAQNRRNNPINTNMSGEWYFYNTTAMAQGNSEWTRQWGNRQLEHWWRFQNVKKDFGGADESDEDEDEENLFGDDLDEAQEELLSNIDDDLKKYYLDIPLTPITKLAAERKLEKAHYNVGKIYFEDLLEPKTGLPYFEALLSRFPETEFESEVLFLLVKIFKELNKPEKEEKYLSLLKEKHENSSFYKVLTNVEVEDLGTDQEVLKLYESMYEAFVEKDFAKTKKRYQEALTNYPGNPIQGKFDLLNAFLTGKTKGRDEYIDDLENVSNTYAGTDVGSHAKDLLAVLQKPEDDLIESTLYDPSTVGEHYFVISGKTKNSDKVQIQLNAYNSEFYPKETYNVKNIRIGDRDLFYISQFQTDIRVKRYYRDLKSAISFFEDAGLEEINYYPITISNFKIMLKEKDEAEYLNFVKNKYN